MLKYRISYKKFIAQAKKYLPLIFGFLAILFFVLSFHSRSYKSVLSNEVKKVERSVHKRQTLMDQYVMRAMNTPNDQWLDFDMPEDMVLYKYCGDTIQSWINGFPISNDEVDVYPFMYRLQYMSNGNLYSTPLAYIGLEESYVNFGTAWYIVNTHINQNTRTKIISGILVRTEYEAENVDNIVNDNLAIDKEFITVPISTDDSAVVYGNEGKPLFSIVLDVPYESITNNLTGKWLSFFFGILALFALHSKERTKMSFAMLSFGVILVRVASSILTGRPAQSSELFSPVLFASNFLFNSLGDFLLNSGLISILAYGLFVLRYNIYRGIISYSKSKKWLVEAMLVAFSALLVVYIHISLRSLIFNSNIVLEPFRLDKLSFYSILCFFAFAMLFLALLLILQMIYISLRGNRNKSLLSWKSISIYIVLISFYTVSTIGISSMRKEFETGRVWTNKLAVERDLNLELQLINVETAIATDPFMAMLSSLDNRDLILKRLLERYLYRGIDQQYNIEITVCSPNNLLFIGGGTDPMGCFPFYQDQINRFGTPLTNNSLFFFMNTYDGMSSYLGVFTFIDMSTMEVNRLFIEIKSKFTQNGSGYDFFSQNADYNINLPKQYSYARYLNNRLSLYGGTYNYPVEFYQGNSAIGYKREIKDGYIHYINYLSDGKTTIVSRPIRQFLTYVVSFSYFAIFFGLFLLLCTHKSRKRRMLDLPRHSLKRKITLLTTMSMVAALLSMGAASIIYTAKSRNDNNIEGLENVIQSVSSALSDYCVYIGKYVELNNNAFFNGMSEIAKIAQVDINIYDTHGGLIRSTKPEVFEQYYMGKRMNNKAYHEIFHNHALKYITVETIANIRYYSVYAPLFNEDGDMVAIVNVPYFSDAEDFNEATSSAVSTIINLYLLLLLSALLIATFVSNSMSRPLAEIKRRMENLTTSGKNAHIHYNNSKDELGVLVTAYNKMVDDLDESTRQLAQSEREQAWREMARHIAHEIKNPLTPMRLSIQHLMRLKNNNEPGWEAKLDELNKSLLEQIDILSDKASEFSSIAKMFNEEIVTVELNELINDNVVLFKSSDNVNVVFKSDIYPAYVEVREKQLSRVFMNIISNGVQALDGIENGLVQIELAESDAEYILTFDDNGPGVAPENLNKLFKPNFTTKSSGTGLGLAISYNIITQSRGTLSYSQSELGGACFTICLPKNKD